MKGALKIMALLTRKLYIRKNGVVTAINLYSTTAEINGSNYLTLRVDGALAYAKLDTVGAVNTTPLRVRKNGVVYQVSSSAVVPYATVQFTASGTFTVPLGVTRLKVTAIGGGGGGGGADNDGYGTGGTIGNYVVSTITVTALASYAVVVGEGGAGSAYSPRSPKPGSNGSASSFGGTLVTVAGGTGSGNKVYPANMGVQSPYSPYGDSGRGGTTNNGPLNGVAGNAGMVLVEYGGDIL